MATSYLVRNRNLLKGVKPFRKRMQEDETKDKPVQQDDLLKDFMLKIVNAGLAEAYEIYGDSPPGPSPPTEVASQIIPDIGYDVIIVGAGMAGLSAAYELKREGLSVRILEQTERYGGRVYTYDSNSDCENDCLAPGLYGEAGAMRFPGDVNDDTDRPHFLTSAYVNNFEGLKIQMFPNSDPNGITNIYGLKEKTSDWGGIHFDTVWSNWKDGIREDMKDEIDNIDKYYEKTTSVVTNQLIERLNDACNNTMDEVAVWDHWIDIWSQFTLESFLESNIDVIKAKIPVEDRDHLDLDTLAKLLPWSNDALRGYSVSTYTEQLDQSLVQYLRDQLGHWWSDNMHTMVGGMHSLPKAFFSDGVLSEEDVDFHKQVSKMSYHCAQSKPNRDYVEVTCYAHDTEPESKYIARAVIVTTPVNILRQITFIPVLKDDATKDALRKNIQAIEDIYTGPATKIILQTKSRFWENKLTYNIQGGFSKTNLPIGQIHYVRPDPEYIGTTNQGLILIYTWKNEALLFGSLTRERARQETIEQVAEIHPEINEQDEVEKCIVHAWYNHPSYQGAYGLLKTTQFNNIRYLWDPMGNVHFSGENLSFAPGWIQGALESGLRSAYQVYARHMSRVPGKMNGKGEK